MSFNRKIACMAVAAATLFAASAQAVPTLYAANGNYYDFIDVPIDWASANTAASSTTYMGATGHLATVTSAGENSFILSTFGSGFASFGPWLGGFQSGGPEPAGGWEWVTGETWSFTAWGGGEPNNAGPEGNLHYLNGAGWNDADGTLTFDGYIVEFEAADIAAVPAPATALLLAPALGFAALRRRRGTGKAAA